LERESQPFEHRLNVGQLRLQRDQVVFVREDLHRGGQENGGRGTGDPGFAKDGIFQHGREFPIGWETKHADFIAGL
jgi:hypothetical protein